MKQVKVISAEWCQNCGPFKASLDRAGIPYESLDADDEKNMPFIVGHHVRSLPTTLIFEDSVLIGQVVGNDLKKVKEILGA
ncbi:hypothetical protein D3C78_899570 [compost metagenome]